MYGVRGYDADGLVSETVAAGYFERSGGTMVRVRDLTADEAAMIAARQAAADTAEAAAAARAALADALALAPLYPAPSPEETAIIDSQVSAALSAFRALADPPADVVALAAAVVSWRAEIA